MGRPFLDLSNYKTDTMQVLCKSGNTSKGKINWLCKCFCGNEYVRTGSHIIANRGKHCGCLLSKNISEGHTSHKMTGTKEFRAWCSMKSRCLSKTNKNYDSYCGRGIKVHESWLNSFDNFFKDLGLAPSINHSLDRINVNGNYEPSNCRWATAKEQCANKRNNIYIDEQTKSLLWERFGKGAIYQRTLWRMKHKNMGLADAIFQPAWCF